jgi:hypothetical protein
MVIETRDTRHSLTLRLIGHVNRTFHYVLDVWPQRRSLVLSKEIPDNKIECEDCEGRVWVYCSPKQAEHAAKDTRGAMQD